MSNIKASKKVAGQRKYSPLKKLMTSLTFVALMIVHIGGNWGFYTLMSGTPLFLSNIHHFDLTSAWQVE
jgi:hypothetical protein